MSKEMPNIFIVKMKIGWRFSVFFDSGVESSWRLTHLAAESAAYKIAEQGKI